jgi:GDP-L-fucose synthase
MVGSSIVRSLMAAGYRNIITKNHSELDLTNQQMVANFFENERPDKVYLAAARVGGIYANDRFPAEFLYENLMIEANVIHQAYKHGVKKLLFLGSSCIYPKLAQQPMCEETLLSGKLEPTNEPYAIAKIAGIKLCESYNRQYGLSNNLDYRSVMPTNLYGPGDNYHPINSHVIPALIRRFHEAKIQNLPEVIIWGTGSPMREFLFVDDLAAACIYVMELEKELYESHVSPMLSHINIGSGVDISILDLAKTISDIGGYQGKISFDKEKPDGSPKKLMDSQKIRRLGWSPKINFALGLKKTYEAFLDSKY